MWKGRKRRKKRRRRRSGKRVTKGGAEAKGGEYECEEVEEGEEGLGEHAATTRVRR